MVISSQRHIIYLIVPYTHEDLKRKRLNLCEHQSLLWEFPNPVFVPILSIPNAFATP